MLVDEEACEGRPVEFIREDRIQGVVLGLCLECVELGQPSRDRQVGDQCFPVLLGLLVFLVGFLTDCLDVEVIETNLVDKDLLSKAKPFQLGLLRACGLAFLLLSLLWTRDSAGNALRNKSLDRVPLQHVELVQVNLQEAAQVLNTIEVVLDALLVFHDRRQHSSVVHVYVPTVTFDGELQFTHPVDRFCHLLADFGVTSDREDSLLVLLLFLFRIK